MLVKLKVLVEPFSERKFLWKKGNVGHPQAGRLAGWQAGRAGRASMPAIDITVAPIRLLLLDILQCPPCVKHSTLTPRAKHHCRSIKLFFLFNKTTHKNLHFPSQKYSCLERYKFLSLHSPFFYYSYFYISFIKTYIKFDFIIF